MMRPMPLFVLLVLMKVLRKRIDAKKAGSAGGGWEAGKPEVLVMQTRTTKHRVEHPSTLTSMNNLALSWKSQVAVLMLSQS